MPSALAAALLFVSLLLSITTNTYDQQGNLTSSTGGGQTPTKSTTDPTTGTSTLTTFASGSLSSGPGVKTTWQSDPVSGALQYQQYANNSKQSYGYNAKGQLTNTTFTAANGQTYSTTTYGYNTTTGIQNSTTYSLADSSSPSFTYQTTDFDDQGRTRILTETTGPATVTRTFNYNADIAPTNNLAEQDAAVRGHRPAAHPRHPQRAGTNLVSADWTTAATCLQQGRSLFEYLCSAIQASFAGRPAPSLLASGP